jgi:hypothetical protein
VLSRSAEELASLRSQLAGQEAQMQVAMTSLDQEKVTVQDLQQAMSAQNAVEGQDAQTQTEPRAKQEEQYLTCAGMAEEYPALPEGLPPLERAATAAVAAASSGRHFPLGGSSSSDDDTDDDEDVFPLTTRLTKQPFPTFKEPPPREAAGSPRGRSALHIEIAKAPHHRHNEMENGVMGEWEQQESCGRPRYSTIVLAQAHDSLQC